MPRTKTPKGKIFVPVEDFTTEIDGQPVVFKRNQTRVREGHPALHGRQHLFQEMKVDYEIEQATAAPGERRGDR